MKKIPSLPFKGQSLGYLNIVAKFFSYIITIALLLFGIVGLASAFLNPFTYLLPYVENCYSYFNLTACGTETYLVQLETLATTLNHYMWYTVIGSASMVAVGLLQPESRRTYSSLPRKAIRTYVGIKNGRDWVIAKIELLNAESAKWKTTFNIMKSPYTLLIKLGFSPQMALGLLFASSTVGTGIVANETVFADKCFSCGDYGEYNAPSAKPLDRDYSDNTLQINLGAIPVREITIENVSVGTVYTGDAAGSEASILPSGKSEAILISGNPISADPVFAATRIEIGKFIFEKSRCKSVDFSDADIHTIIIEHNASDGQSIIQTSGSARNRAIGGGHHQAEAMITSGGTYDRIWIDAPSSGVNGKIGTLTLSNVYSKGGTCTFKNLDIGTLIIRQNEIGNDSDLATKEFQITNTVTGANWTVTDNVEITMSEPATQLGNP